MHCPRLEHFVRLNHTGKIGKCGHMTRAQEFTSFDEMQESDWLRDVKDKMEKNIWPGECVRCAITEETSNSSVRLDMIERHKILYSMKKNYLIVGGVLDNICNSACQSCNEELSTKIGSLSKKNYKKINNYDNFFSLPQERILEVDVNGGEPTASPNYKKLLKNLPISTKIIRINTNGSRTIPELEKILEKKMRVIVTISFDGTEKIHNYTRWPILWKDYTQTIKEYLKLRKRYETLRLNFWTTITCFNVRDLKNIIAYAKEMQIDHAHGYCLSPQQLDIRYNNIFTEEAKKYLLDNGDKFLTNIGNKCGSFNIDNSVDLKKFIDYQDALRKIYIQDYFNFDLNLSRNNLANT